MGSEKFLPAIQVMIDRYTKADPPTKKMLPVEANVLELMVEMGYGKEGLIKAQAVGDLAVIAFCYLLRIGEYTVKRKKNKSKQTVQFKLEDVSFFKKTKWGNLVCLPKNAPYSLIATADSATLKLDNKKMDGKGFVCTRRLMEKQPIALFKPWPDG